jgi:MobA/MobL family
MAIGFVRATVASRSKGKNAVAMAAYRSGEVLYDRANDKVYDYTKKQGIDYSEILAPIEADWVVDRQKLWNRVEEGERRKDSQLSREIIIAIPRELSRTDKVALVREHIQASYVDRGMVADFNLHHIDGNNPHAHVMLTMRDLTIDEAGNIGFGRKNTSWNAKKLLQNQKKEWDTLANQYLERSAIPERIDTRSYEERGSDRLGQVHLGIAAHEMRARGIPTELGARYDRIEWLNANMSEQLEQVYESELAELTLPKWHLNFNGLGGDKTPSLNKWEPVRLQAASTELLKSLANLEYQKGTAKVDRYRVTIVPNVPNRIDIYRDDRLVVYVDGNNLNLADPTNTIDRYEREVISAVAIDRVERKLPELVPEPLYFSHPPRPVTTTRLSTLGASRMQKLSQRKLSPPQLKNNPQQEITNDRPIHTSKSHIAVSSSRGTTYNSLRRLPERTLALDNELDKSVLSSDARFDRRRPDSMRRPRPSAEIASRSIEQPVSIDRGNKRSPKYTRKQQELDRATIEMGDAYPTLCQDDNYRAAIERQRQERVRIGRSIAKQGIGREDPLVPISESRPLKKWQPQPIEPTSPELLDYLERLGTFDRVELGDFRLTLQDRTVAIEHRRDGTEFDLVLTLDLEQRRSILAPKDGYELAIGNYERMLRKSIDATLERASEPVLPPIQEPIEVGLEPTPNDPIIDFGLYSPTVGELRRAYELQRKDGNARKRECVREVGNRLRDAWQSANNDTQTLPPPDYRDSSVTLTLEEWQDLNQKDTPQIRRSLSRSRDLDRSFSR